MAGSRGRPIGSEVRNNIIDILGYMGKAYGYELNKVYREVFPAVTLRSIYYHLKKALSLGLVKVEVVERSEGNYSWGSTAEKTFYSLTEKANPRKRKELDEYFSRKG